MSGIKAGIYALIGAYVGYKIVYTENSGLLYRDVYLSNPTIWWPLFLVAAVVLTLSVITGIWLTIKQARKKGETFWNPVSKRLLLNMAIPLVTGGLFI